MRNKLVLLSTLSLLTCTVVPASAQQVSIGFWSPNVSIGINLPMYPDLVPVPGYPVYYAPRLNSNYFFYDGMYWVYLDDNWYASSWYNGPWGLVAPEYVPLFILRIPVRYYRQPPMYFRGWQSDAPPRWGEHWGNDWERRRSGWNRWNRNAVPGRPPLPLYQRNYSGDRYPHQVEQQQELHSQNYRYQPRDPVVRLQYQAQRTQSAPAPIQHEKQDMTPERKSVWPGGNQRSNPPRDIQQSAPSAPQTQAPPLKNRPSLQQGQQPEQKAAPRQRPEQRDVQRQRHSEQRNVQNQQPAPQSRSQETRPQGNEAQQEPKRRQRSGKEKDRER
ncbi:conserved exported protein of unknown function [Georgfuchsia toluolica]|uniref:YXWGXW repeat-containing protein n=1 Tax=Georgfuchsia toluolica TaxID=424218 RepID=A0A916J3B7_9PROT|nr:hypothetical protein [Georgfuchsia toluolica]CAG4883055.1 conserved exported protein of unknown function [Georgfuchsia toluolica]